VLVYWRGAGDAVGADAVATALRAGARVVVVTRSDAEAAAVRAAHRVRGVVSLETLARDAGLRWPEAMPDYDEDADGYRAYQDATLKPFGLAVGRVLAAPDNPRGYPDVVVERAGQDTLGVSTFLARPFTGVVVYLEDTAEDRLSFYAPNVWMHQKRVLFPGFAILGSHLSNAHQAEEVVRLLDGGALALHPPGVHAWDELAEAHQAMHDNRHAGTLTVRVGATAALDSVRTARQVYAAWGARFVDGRAVHVRIDAVRPGWPECVALVTLDVPPANALSGATLDDLERALDTLEAEPHLRAAVLTGGGSLFVAGADIRQLRALARAEEVEALAVRAQRLFGRLARLPAPVIAAVDGYALGGGNELQMACAYRIASRRAELGQPEINLHVIPGFGGTQMLPRLAARRARLGGGQMFSLLIDALAVLLDGRRRPAERMLALGVVDEVAPADAVAHALGVARRIALGQFTGALWSPLTEDGTLAFPNVERDPEIQRLLAHHAHVPRAAPARAILDLVHLGFTQGVTAGLAAEARAFGRLVASEEGRAGLDRFLARRSLPLPLRHDDR
jgi:enoyl-CoA hydratase/carnithine racemase